MTRDSLNPIDSQAFGRKKIQNEKGLKYDKGIDLVRFLAFFFVFFTHFINHGGLGIALGGGQWWDFRLLQRVANFGGQGVTIFFCLTGFLLGRLLIKEFNLTNTISITSFYMRRVLRIWPLYFLFLIACTFLNIFSKSPTITLKELPYLLSFTYNWGQIFSHLPGTMATITWSISIEEQIYLFFPFLLLIFRWRKFKVAAYLLIVIGLVSRYYVVFILGSSPYRNTLCYLDVVGFGVLVAIHEDTLLNKFKNSYVLTVFLPLLLAAYVLTFDALSSSKTGIFLGFFLTSLCVPILLIFFKNLRVEQRRDWILLDAFAFIGRRSYGCYLFHWMVWQIMVGEGIGFDRRNGFSIVGVILGFTLTVTLSAISYRYFEQPFLSMRNKYKRVLSP